MDTASLEVPQTSAADIQHYLTLLFPDPPPDAWLVVSVLKPGTRGIRSRWFPAADYGPAAAFLATQAITSHTYVNLGLRDPTCTPAPSARGESKDICAIGSLWMDFDHAGGLHASRNLPSADQLMEFLKRLPFRFSLLIDTGGGLHAYLLFKELWLLPTLDERERAATLLQRFQRTIAQHAAQEKFHVDTTASLAQMLRPFGTLNHKTIPPRPVILTYEGAIRYNPSDLENASWLIPVETIPARASTYAPETPYPPADLEPIVHGCAWLAHCRDDAATLTEPEWYAMLSIVGRCEDGEQLAHDWSTSYARYTHQETQEKLRQALRPQFGARSCADIREERGGEPYCAQCVKWGKIHTPIVLGMRPAPDPLTGTTMPPVPLMVPPPAPETLVEPAPAIVPLIDPKAMYTDTYNARALVRYHGQDLHYCYPWKSWLVWTGAFWQRDTSGQVMELAKKAVTRLARLAEGMSKAEVARLFKHIEGSLATSRLHALVTNAQSEAGIPIQPETLDADEWALNVTNGTLDLTSGTLRPHRQADLMTKGVPIAYDPDAPCPRWDAFLWRIMGGSQGADSEDMSTAQLEARHEADLRAGTLIDFLQRAIGYSLTGSTQEQCIFILHGPTKTGKSTFLATVRALLGPYGQQADMSSFLRKEKDEVRNDLADLAGSRVVCALESQEGRRLSESLVKQLTGGADLVKARFLFQEYFSYKPQFKIFLGTNHKPIIKDTDNAIWERIRLVPFIVSIPPGDRNKQLEQQLVQELPGILAWAVRGCLAWQQRGDLGEPPAVVDATTGYRTEMDNVGRFLDECCVHTPPAKIKATMLSTAYQTWCRTTNEEALSNLAFVANLETRGYTRARGTANQYYWHGLGLLDTSPSLTTKD